MVPNLPIKSVLTVAGCLCCAIASYAGLSPVRTRSVVPQRVLRIALGDTNPHSLTFTRDGRRLICLAENRALCWHARTGKRLEAMARVTATRETVMAVSPDGGVAVCRSRAAPATVRLREVKTGILRLTLRLPGQKSVVLAVFAPRGRLLALADEAGAVTVCDARTGVRRWSARSPRIDALRADLSFSPDGRALVVAFPPSPAERRGDEIRAFDARSGTQRWRRIDRHSHTPTAVSPNGRLVATGGEAVRLLDLRTGNTLRTMRQHERHRVWSLAIARGGRLVVGSGSHGPVDDEQPEVRGWNAATGRLEWTLRFREAGPIAVSPDGRRLAAVADGAIQVWRLP
jgi:WD40 repeat protein